MNASQRRIFRRALSASLGLTIGQPVKHGSTIATLERVSPNGARTLLVKCRNNRRVVWPLSACEIRA